MSSIARLSNLLSGFCSSAVESSLIFIRGLLNLFFLTRSLLDFLFMSVFSTSSGSLCVDLGSESCRPLLSIPISMVCWAILTISSGSGSGKSFDDLNVRWASFLVSSSNSVTRKPNFPSSKPLISRLSILLFICFFNSLLDCVAILQCRTVRPAALVGIPSFINPTRYLVVA